MTSTPATYRAGFAVGDEAAAKLVVDILTEVFFEGDAVVAAYESPGGRWGVSVHFAAAPDQALVRELVSNAAGGKVAKNIAFDTVEGALIKIRLKSVGAVLPRRSNNSWTPDEDERLRCLMEAGKTARTISTDFKRTTRAIRRRAERLKLSWRMAKLKLKAEDEGRGIPTIRSD